MFQKSIEQQKTELADIEERLQAFHKIMLERALSMEERDEYLQMSRYKLELESISHCLRCGNQWEARVESPKRCPACKSSYWNKKKRDN